MVIKKERFGDAMDVALEGRLDTQSSRLLEHELEQSYHELRELNIDLTGLEYISSAGLSVLLIAQRRMNRQGAFGRAPRGSKELRKQSRNQRLFEQWSKLTAEQQAELRAKSEYIHGGTH